jgi:EAL domain-containing protein (putative c-di-GMP-specific phosphodiesterase class I)
VERQSIEEDLRTAVQRNEFTLQYQPKVNLKTGVIVGAEALLRWTHSDRGSIPPSRFISIAEDTGLILEIGAWVLREACNQAQAWVEEGLPRITMAVNVSAVQLGHETFVADLFSTLAQTGLDPRSLELEVTETVLMKHASLAASILQKLRDKGILVSVDDFGTGYSSLSYLKEFPLDSLKIDQSFVLQADRAPNDSTLVSAIVSMGHSLNLCVIAEGVETLEAAEFLKALDCDEAQGLYFSGPVCAEQFARLLGNGISRNLAPNGKNRVAAVRRRRSIKVGGDRSKWTADGGRSPAIPY